MELTRRFPQFPSLVFFFLTAFLLTSLSLSLSAGRAHNLLETMFPIALFPFSGADRAALIGRFSFRFPHRGLCFEPENFLFSLFPGISYSLF